VGGVLPDHVPEFATNPSVASAVPMIAGAAVLDGASVVRIVPLAPTPKHSPVTQETPNRASPAGACATHADPAVLVARMLDVPTVQQELDVGQEIALSW
jgi:hypothetical protein